MNRLYEIMGWYAGGVVAARNPTHARKIAADAGIQSGYYTRSRMDDLEATVIRGRQVTGPPGVIYEWAE